MDLPFRVQGQELNGIWGEGLRASLGLDSYRLSV